MVCDRRQITQALTNIIKNAAEAVEARTGPADPGEVTMRLAMAGEELLLTLEDNGIGLPRERERITEPYMTTRARGTGLGLAIVKNIVEQHFGTIEFDDRAGGGTVVRLCFDLAKLASPTPPNYQIASPNHRTTEPPHRTMEPPHRTTEPPHRTTEPSRVLGLDNT